MTKVRDLVREEMVGAYPLDPALAVDVASATTGRRPIVTECRLRSSPVATQ